MSEIQVAMLSNGVVLERYDNDRAVCVVED